MRALGWCRSSTNNSLRGYNVVCLGTDPFLPGGGFLPFFWAIHWGDKQTCQIVFTVVSAFLQMFIRYRPRCSVVPQQRGHSDINATHTRCRCFCSVRRVLAIAYPKRAVRLEQCAFSPSAPHWNTARLRHRFDRYRAGLWSPIWRFIHLADWVLQVGLADRTACAHKTPPYAGARRQRCHGADDLHAMNVPISCSLRSLYMRGDNATLGRDRTYLDTVELRCVGDQNIHFVASTRTRPSSFY